MYLHHSLTAGPGIVVHLGRGGDEVAHLEHRQFGLRGHRVAHADHELALDDGHVLIGRMPVRLDHVVVGQLEPHGDDGARGGVALQHHHLGAGGEDGWRGSPGQLVGALGRIGLGVARGLGHQGGRRGEGGERDEPCAEVNVTGTHCNLSLVRNPSCTVDPQITPISQIVYLSICQRKPPLGYRVLGSTADIPRVSDHA